MKTMKYETLKYSVIDDQLYFWKVNMNGTCGWCLDTTITGTHEELVAYVKELENPVIDYPLPELKINN